MEQLNLKKDDDGNIFVVQNVQTEEPISADELRRQIRQHADVIVTLETQLSAIETFSASELTVDSTLIEKQTASIIDSVQLEAMAPLEAIKVEDVQAERVTKGVE